MSKIEKCENFLNHKGEIHFTLQRINEKKKKTFHSYNILYLSETAENRHVNERDT